MESPASEVDSLANKEVFLSVVLPSSGVLVSLSLKELTSNSSRVLITFLIDLDGVISTEEGEKEDSGLIIWLSRDEFALESKDMHVLFEDLLFILLRSRGLKGLHGSHGVLLASKSIVRRHWIEEKARMLGVEVDGMLSDAKSLIVELMSEIIAVVDQAVSAEDVDVLSADKVIRSVELLLLQAHSRVVCLNFNFWNFALGQKHREWISATVLGELLLDLNLIVGEVEVENIVFHASMIGCIVP